MSPTERHRKTGAPALFLLWMKEGGAAELASLMRRIRAETSGRSTGEPTLLVLAPAPATAAVASAGSEDQPVVSVSHGTALVEGAIHLLPAGRCLVVEKGRFCLRPAPGEGDAERIAALLPSLPRSRDGLAVIVHGALDEAEATLLREVLGPEGRLLGADDLLPSQNLSGEAIPLSVPAPPAPASPGTAHELRQPLQTLVLLHSLLKKQVTESKAAMLVDRMGVTIGQLTALLANPAPAALRPLAPPPPAAPPAEEPEPAAGADGQAPLVFVIDDDPSIRTVMREVMEAEGSEVRDFESCEDFLAAYGGESHGCLLIDAYLPGMSGLDLLAEMGRRGHPLPSIMMTGSSDVQMAVSAMKMGASDFIEKPVSAASLVSCVRAALSRARNTEAEQQSREKAAQALKGLTRRQKQIMAMVLDGHPSKNIAADLGISQRTVENHRAAIMKKTGSRSLPQLARLVLALPAGEIE